MKRRMHHRNERLSREIQRELGSILLTELSDPRSTFISVNRVELSKDFKYATIYVSALGGESERKACMGVLKHAGGFIQRTLGDRLRVHSTPELRFKYDDSVERSFRIAELLDEVSADADESAEGTSEETSEEVTEEAETESSDSVDKAVDAD